MPEANNQDTGFYILIGIIGFFLLIGLLFGLAQFLNDFMSELRYLNNEIGRTDGEERKHWIWLLLFVCPKKWVTRRITEGMIFRRLNSELSSRQISKNKT